MNVPRLFPNRTSFGGGFAAALLLTVLARALEAQPITLPYTLAGQKISLRFLPDAAVGVKLANLQHHEGGATFLYKNDPASVGLDARLWEIRCTLENGGQVVVVNPTMATGFGAALSSGPNGEPGVYFLWTGIQVSPGNVLRVLLLATLGANDNVSKWYTDIFWDANGTNGPNGGASLDQVDFPICRWIPPVTAQPGEALELAQRTARLLLASNSLHGPFVTANVPLRDFLQHPIPQQGVHFNHPQQHPSTTGATTFPAPGFLQTLQFAAVYNGQVGDPGYRRILYLGSEDAQGWYKQFFYRSHAGPRDRLEWRHVAFPPFSGGTGAPSEWNAFYLSPYPAVMGALMAQDDHWWYDALAYYRNWVFSSALARPRVRDNPLFGQAGGPNLMCASGFLIPTFSGPTLYQRFLDVALTFRKGLENPYVPVTATYMHLQNYLQGGAGVQNPTNPVSTSVDNGVASMLALAKTRDIRAVPYTRANSVEMNVPGSWWNLFLPSDELHDRAGVPLSTVLGSTEAILDLRAPGSQMHLANNMYQQLGGVGFAGAYLDTFSGTGTVLCYDAPSGSNGIEHGNNAFEAGKIATIQNIRNNMRQSSPFAPSGGEDEHAIVTSEVAEEYLAGHLDATQPGHDWPYGLFALGDDVGIAPTGLPLAATDWSIPLWTAVYHEVAPTMMMTVPFSRVGLQFLQAQEFLDMWSYYHALLLVAGIEPSLQTYFIDQDLPLVVLQGGVLTTPNTTLDPTGVGLTALATVRDFYASLEDPHAGKFLLDGRLLRPLAVTNDGVDTELATNPFKDLHTKVPSPFDRLHVFPPPLNPDIPYNPHAALATLDFPVPKVLHSVWRSFDGKVGLILVNWSSAPAQWRATLNPSLQELSTSGPYLVTESIQGGVNLVHGSFSGPIDIRATSGTNTPTTLFIGPVPARSVRVLMFP